jgi:hypothetical protein
LIRFNVCVIWLFLDEFKKTLFKFWLLHACQYSTKINRAFFFVFNPYVPTRFSHNSEIALNEGYLLTLFLEKLVQKNRGENAGIMKFMEPEA